MNTINFTDFTQRLKRTERVFYHTAHDSIEEDMGFNLEEHPFHEQMRYLTNLMDFFFCMKNPGFFDPEIGKIDQRPCPSNLAITDYYRLLLNFHEYYKDGVAKNIFKDVGEEIFSIFFMYQTRHRSRIVGADQAAETFMNALVEAVADYIREVSDSSNLQSELESLQRKNNMSSADVTLAEALRKGVIDIVEEDVEGAKAIAQELKELELALKEKKAEGKSKISVKDITKSAPNLVKVIKATASHIEAPMDIIDVLSNPTSFNKALHYLMESEGIRRKHIKAKHSALSPKQRRKLEKAIKDTIPEGLSDEARSKLENHLENLFSRKSIDEDIDFEIKRTNIVSEDEAFTLIDKLWDLRDLHGRNIRFEEVDKSLIDFRTKAEFAEAFESGGLTLTILGRENDPNDRVLRKKLEKIFKSY